MTVNPTRSDWLDWRRGGIGGSDIAAIVGLGRWGSPYSVWADKIGLLDDNGPNEAQDFGRHFEAMAAPWFTERTGLRVIGEQQWCAHPDRPWMRCTPDGFASESPAASIDNALGVVEWKVTTDKPYTVDTIPAHFACQAQWNMAVTGHERCWLGVLHWRRFEVYELAADPTDQAWLIEEGERFWRDHVLTQTPPPVDGSDATSDTLARIHPDHIADLGVPLDDIADTVTALRAVKADAKTLAEHQQLLENRIKAALGEAEHGTVAGVTTVTWRRTTAVDTDALLAAHPDDCAPFLRLDLTAFTKGVGAAARKRLADTYRTLPGTRRLILKETP